MLHIIESDVFVFTRNKDVDAEFASDIVAIVKREAVDAIIPLETGVRLLVRGAALDFPEMESEKFPPDQAVIRLADILGLNVYQPLANRACGRNQESK